ncbi:hypothetical protein K469DRAFT_714176 [Zopfia rhizophila CBS 207.26]|uniref:Uncharacterized protein n=1 Tax=Zopfia rhizophila CBS 207.26 TaxID=1314779 RepID=A0A6A6DSN2_9PEZI|nr:hypothetical protein K469DRAFT_714176 [Zopfia rhizophila CBS 207.26]
MPSVVARLEPSSLHPLLPPNLLLLLRPNLVLPLLFSQGASLQPHAFDSTFPRTRHVPTRTSRDITPHLHE